MKELANTAACRYVDDVFPEARWEQKVDDIKTYKASIFAMGEDWKGKFNHLSSSKKNIQILYIKDLASL